MSTPQQCQTCINYIGINGDNKQTCLAFPNEIPDKIFFGEKSHISNVPGDGGIKYESFPGEIDIRKL